MNDVGRNIARYRKQKNMTQEALAAELHVTRQALSSWERGRTQPDLDALVRLGEALGVSAQVLLEEAEEESGKRAAGTNAVRHGITFGTVLAIVISYTHWHSVVRAIVHGLLGWLYVIYHALKYGLNG